MVWEPTTPRSATSLAFNPSHRGELWVAMRELGYQGAPCNAPDASGAIDVEACALLEGTVAVIEHAGSTAPIVHVLKDANAWHFMRRTAGIAFGDDDTFATCGEHRTGNYDDEPEDFIGPTLWSADPAIFGPNGPGGNGSHLDMLHATPYCMGIAHEKDNAYWAFNGMYGAVDRYDFHEPHIPGGEDHSDGEATRYLLGELERVPEVPSGLVFDPRDGSLYISDTGHARILKLDTKSGRAGEPLPCDDPALGYFVDQVVGADLTVIVKPGVIERPSGLALSGDVLYVTDNATSRVFAFDLQGRQLARVDTGLPEETVAGIAIGPDGHGYLSDLATSEVRRIVPR